MALGDPLALGIEARRRREEAFNPLLNVLGILVQQEQKKELLEGEQKAKERLLEKEEQAKERLQEKEFTLKKEYEEENLTKKQRFISDILKNAGLNTQTENRIENKSDIGLTGFTLDPTTGDLRISFGQTPEAKIKEQSQLAAAKERETTISKAERLEAVGNRVKQEWIKTSPYKGLITKAGLVPALGAWDILKKGLQATSAQRADLAYADFVQGIRAQLARGMGDVGNLSEYEQKAVIRLIPKLTDSYETGLLKMQQLSGLVDDIRQTRKINKDINQGIVSKIPITPEQARAELQRRKSKQ
jgi:hypothetical protein